MTELSAKKSLFGIKMSDILRTGTSPSRYITVGNVKYNGIDTKKMLISEQTQDYFFQDENLLMETPSIGIGNGYVLNIVLRFKEVFRKENYIGYFIKTMLSLEETKAIDFIIADIETKSLYSGRFLTIAYIHEGCNDLKDDIFEFPDYTILTKEIKISHFDKILERNSFNNNKLSSLLKYNMKPEMLQRQCDILGIKPW